MREQLTKKDLIIAVDRAVESNADYFALIIEFADGDTEATIIKMDTVINTKLNWWKEQYDSKLRHKYNSDVGIVAFSYAKDLEQITKFIYSIW